MRTDKPHPRYGYDTSGGYHVPTVEEPEADQCPDCRCAPNETHSPDCEGAVTWVCKDCGQDGYGTMNPVATWHEGRCDICGETTGVTEPRDFGGYKSVAPENPFPEKLYEMLARACPECGTVRESAQEMSADIDIPFEVQSWMFEALADRELDKLHDLIHDYHDEIIMLARDRFTEAYETYRSRMYGWSPVRRLDETLQELADAVVYATSGPMHV